MSSSLVLWGNFPISYDRVHEDSFINHHGGVRCWWSWFATLMTYNHHQVTILGLDGWISASNHEILNMIRKTPLTLSEWGLIIGNNHVTWMAYPITHLFWRPFIGAHNSKKTTIGPTFDLSNSKELPPVIAAPGWFFVFFCWGTTGRKVVRLVVRDGKGWIPLKYLYYIDIWYIYIFFFLQ